MKRREWMQLASLFTAAGSLPLLQACSERQARQPDAPLRIGYLPITDATPLLVAHSQRLFEAEGVMTERPVPFQDWAQLLEAFIGGQVNLVHMMAPMAVWARYGSQASLKVLMWNHIAGSALTVRPDIDSVAALGGHTVAIPYWYSIHNVVLQHLLRRQGLAATEQDLPDPGQVRLVVMAPADMVAGLAAGRIAGCIVAEPFNALAESQGLGRVLRFTGDVWRDHACCVTVMHGGDVAHRPEWVQKVTTALVKAQRWTLENRCETAALLAASGTGQYTPHTRATLAQVLAPTRQAWADYVARGAIRHPEWQQARIDFQPYPFPSYTEKLVQLLRHTRVAGDNAFLQSLDPARVAMELVDERFVRQAIEATGSRAAFHLAADYTRVETLAA